MSLQLLCRQPDICLEVYEDTMLLSMLIDTKVYGMFLDPEEKGRAPLAISPYSLQDKVTL